MAHLNIPFSRHTTTRRSRRVVWIRALLLASLFFIIAWGSSLWFTRDTLFIAAPSDTAFAVRLFTGGSRSVSIQRLFSELPLVSDRSLRYEDLAPYLNGEMMLFFQADGTRSVAFRAKQAVPEDVLANRSLVSTSFDHHIYRLSSHPMDAKPFSLKRSILLPLPFPGHVWIGEWIDFAEQSRSRLTLSATSLSVSLPSTDKKHETFSQLPPNTIAYLSTPTWTTTAVTPVPLLTQLLAPIADPSFLTFLSSVPKTNGSVVITEENKQLGFLLTQEQAQPPLQIESALRSLVALNYPKLVVTPLGDDTSIRELVTDPSAVSVEELSLFGRSTMRVSLQTTELYAGHTDENSLFFTNSQTLLSSLYTSSSDSPLICHGNSGGLLFSPFRSLAVQGLRSPQHDPLYFFSIPFHSAGIQKTFFSQKIHFCF